MIVSIDGTVEARGAGQAIVGVGGFSLRIFATATTLSRLGEPGSEVTLYTHFQVREDGMALFGFSSETERDAFEQLINISGVGPKVGLALLSTMDSQSLYKAIADEDLQRISLAPGVGKKLSARLVLGVKGKLPARTGIGDPGTSNDAGNLQAERRNALVR